MFGHGDPMDVDAGYTQDKSAISRDQLSVITCLNYYQKALNRPLISLEGYCQGLSLLWLQKAIEGKLGWFYRIRDQVLTYTADQTMVEEIDVEKFMALMIAAQETFDYGEPGTVPRHKTFIKDLFEQHSYEENRKTFNLSDLAKLFRVRRNPIQFCVAGNGHAIAVFMIKGCYVVFDSNYESGMHKIFTNTDDVVREIKYCLFDDFNELAPRAMALRLFVLRPEKQIAEIDIDLSQTSQLEYRDVRARAGFFQSSAQKPIEQDLDDSFCVIL